LKNVTLDHPSPAQVGAAGWDRFAPAALRRALLQHGADAPDEQFDAAVLLADVSGYSTLATRLAEQSAIGAERLSQHLNATFGVMLREVYARGGEVERFAGDALLASFRPLGDGLGGAVRRARDCAQAIAVQPNGTGTGTATNTHTNTHTNEVALSVHAGVAVGALHTRHLTLPGGDKAFVLWGEPLRRVASAAMAAASGQVQLEPAAALLAQATQATNTAQTTPTPARGWTGTS